LSRKGRLPEIVPVLISHTMHQLEKQLRKAPQVTVAIAGWNRAGGK
jgi:hypothetical protein